MKRSEIATSQMGHLTICLKEDVDRYIDYLTKALHMFASQECGAEVEEHPTEEDTENLVEWIMHR